MKKATGDHFRHSELRDRHAFTLLELLIAIAILGVLVALLFPFAKNGINSANTSKCISNQRQLVSGILLYAGESNNQLPACADYTTGQTWEDILAPYFDGKQAGRNYLRCPSASVEDVGTYGVNYACGYRGGVFGLPPIEASKRLATLKAGTILCADLSDKGGGLGSSFLSPSIFPFDSDYDGNGEKDSTGSLVSRGPYNFVSFRHSGKTAVAGFADGSVRQITIPEWERNEGGMWGPSE